jgi:threonylcarbamoyladenosine tRNA methylthiotransferase MtaB
VPRVRLSSLEPEDLSRDLLAIWSGERCRLCSHFHLPLQHGSDTVLERMGRRYRAADFARLVEEVNQSVPGAAITTDIMVGFPGESEREHEENLAFAESIRLAGAHVFRYSPRQGTRAALMPGRVPAGVAKRRSEEMIALAKKSEARFRARFIGQNVTVLFEERLKTADGLARWTGLSDNYLRVGAESCEELGGQLRQVVLVGETAEGLIGDPASSRLAVV